jgi:thiosulfate dehydrogenase
LSASGAFSPEYRARGGAIDSLQERINDCFLRSMNGKPLAWDSAEMNAILMYIHWLSTGVPTGTSVTGRGMGSVDNTLKPNAAHGKLVYAEKCASCHGARRCGHCQSGGRLRLPACLGQCIVQCRRGHGAHLHRRGLHQAEHAVGQGNTLSDQDAIDVAEYVTHQPRPAFAAAKADYAKGPKPGDARN